MTFADTQDGNRRPRDAVVKKEATPMARDPACGMNVDEKQAAAVAA
jgi:hypothetical protein